MSRPDRQAASTGHAFEVIRDPLWDNIRLEEAAISVVDSVPKPKRDRRVMSKNNATSAWTCVSCSTVWSCPRRTDVRQ